MKIGNEFFVSFVTVIVVAYHNYCHNYSHIYAQWFQLMQVGIIIVSR